MTVIQVKAKPVKPWPEEVEERNRTIGGMLRATRVAGSLSLRDAAEYMGLSAVELGEYERGVKEPRSWRGLFQQMAGCIYSAGYQAGEAPVGER